MLAVLDLIRGPLSRAGFMYGAASVSERQVDEQKCEKIQSITDVLMSLDSKVRDSLGIPEYVRHAILNNPQFTQNGFTEEDLYFLLHGERETFQFAQEKKLHEFHLLDYFWVKDLIYILNEVKSFVKFGSKDVSLANIKIHGDHISSNYALGELYEGSDAGWRTGNGNRYKPNELTGYRQPNGTVVTVPKEALNRYEQMVENIKELLNV